MIEGLLDRRILLNYHFEPDALRRFLPAPFAPRLYQGRGIGGVCMIRFRHLRPRHFPERIGVDSENAAHRIAVQWDAEGVRHEGVFIPRRDTASAFNHWAGGTIFPGLFDRALFTAREETPEGKPGRYHVEIAAPGQSPHVVFDGEETAELSPTSLFPTLAEASEFFAKGAVGYSPAREKGKFEGMELRLLEWDIAPLKINAAYVRLYEDGAVFPQGAVQLDSAMVMRRLNHEWHTIPVIKP